MSAEGVFDPEKSRNAENMSFEMAKEGI